MDTETDLTQPERPARRIRRQNLLRLIAECGSTRGLAVKTGTVDTLLSAILSRRRGMGDDLAAKLEQGTGKPFGWMDLEPAASEQAVESRAA